MKRVALLGATGSIGRQAIEIVADHDDLDLCGLMSGSRSLDALAAEHGVAHTQVGGSAVSLLEECVPDIVLNAIVGFAGVEATLWALEHGVTLALANKESLVAAGELAVATHRKGGGLLLPVDSEHSALAQCLEGAADGSVMGLVITASGGPFRGYSQEQLATVTREQALNHPTWNMGAKITVDSATLMNKGLELIEAHHLFGIDYDAIEVVVHPQSIVHGMVRFRDGALIAHLGLPDMRVPISWALTYPQRAATPAPQLDLQTAFTLEFEPPAVDVFRCLLLAREAGRAGGTAPCTLNAANEVAVAAFLAGGVGFADIAGVVEQTLERTDVAPLVSLEQVLEADARARVIASELVAVAA
jgi:1-deoxy-D-xylulose-5-phosphate reductoisomerase